MPGTALKGSQGFSQRSHENRGGGRRHTRNESALERKRRQRNRETKGRKRWNYAVKKYRETQAYRKKFVDFLKRDGRARPFLPKAMIPEPRIDEPRVAVSHFGKGTVVMGRMCGIHVPAHSKKGRGALCVIEIMKIVSPLLLTFREGRPPKSVSQYLALPCREVYQCPVTMCEREGILWRGRIRWPLPLVKHNV